MDQLQPPATWTTPDAHWDWIAERLGPFGKSVSSVVPVGFPAYARSRTGDTAFSYHLIMATTYLTWFSILADTGARSHGA